MNVYFEHCGVIGNCLYMGKLKKLMKPNEPVELFVRSDRHVGLFGLMVLATLNPRIRNIEVTLPAAKVLPHMITFANASPSFTLRFTVDGKLTKRVWKQVSRLTSTIYIQDQTEGLNREFYESCRKVIFSDKLSDGIAEAEAYAMAVKTPLKNCRYSSCLGKTLFVSRGGDISFCPVYPEQTKLGHLRELKTLFHTELFGACLAATISRRAACKASCPRFNECMGGCPFSADCGDFLKRCDQAEADVQNLIDQRYALCAVPLYKEQAIIYRLFSRSKHPDLSHLSRKEEPCNAQVH